MTFFVVYFDPDCAGLTHSAPRCLPGNDNRRYGMNLHKPTWPTLTHFQAVEVAETIHEIY
ncbi:MAG: hypothetical protein R6V21_00960 [Pelovirga sp.]